MKKMSGFAVIVLGIFLLSYGCEKADLTAPGEEKGQPVAGTEAPMLSGSINVANITFASGGKSVIVPVEIAATDEERMKGLMGRTELPFKTGGMWFVFPEDMNDPFWMKDTAVSLDMVFVGPDMKVVDIKASTVPNSEDKLFSKAPYRYVLEVAAGFAAKNNIVEGDTVVYGIGPAK